MLHQSARLLAITLIMSGCGVAAPPNPSGDAAEFPPTAEVEALRLPFDAYDFSLAELYTISNAEDLLTSTCMAAKGLDWQVIERPTDLKDLRNRRRYGVIEMPIAGQFGYHVPAGLLTPVNVELQYDKRDAGLSEKQKEAALAENGCAHEAVRRLRPAESPDQGLLHQLSRQSLDESQDEPTVAAAMRSWRDCVHESGFTYQDPFAAVADSQWWADNTVEPSRQEIAVAVADVRCKERTGLVRVWHAAEARIQEEAIGRHLEYLTKLRDAMDKSLAAARAVLTRS